MDKDLLLDVDGKSYCKVRVEVKCVAKNEFAWDTYLKCNDYEDENYGNWEENKKKGENFPISSCALRGFRIY